MSSDQHLSRSASLDKGPDPTLAHWKKHEVSLIFRSGVPEADFFGRLRELYSRPFAMALANNLDPQKRTDSLNFVNLREVGFQQSDPKKIPRIPPGMPVDQRLNAASALSGFVERDVAIYSSGGAIRGKLLAVFSEPSFCALLADEHDATLLRLVNIDLCPRIEIFPSNGLAQLTELPEPTSVHGDSVLKVILSAAQNKPCRVVSRFDEWAGVLALFIRKDKSNLGPRIIFARERGNDAETIAGFIPWAITVFLEFKASPARVKENLLARHQDDDGNGGGANVPARLPTSPGGLGAHAACELGEDDE